MKRSTADWIVLALGTCGPLIFLLSPGGLVSPGVASDNSPLTELWSFDTGG